MVFTDATWKYFSLTQFEIRSALVKSESSVPYEYEGESFFEAYSFLFDIWMNQKSIRQISTSSRTGREKLMKWEKEFVRYGTIGLLPKISQRNIDPQLEKLIILI